MAIQQKLALTQRLEDLQFHKESKQVVGSRCQERRHKPQIVYDLPFVMSNPFPTFGPSPVAVPQPSPQHSAENGHPTEVGIDAETRRLIEFDKESDQMVGSTVKGEGINPQE